MLLHNLDRLLGIVRGNGKADILCAVASDGLQDNVNIDIMMSKVIEEFKSDTGLVLKTANCDKRGIFVAGNTADKHFFHFSILLYYCSFIRIQTGAYNKLYAVFFRHFNGAVVKNSRA